MVTKDDDQLHRAAINAHLQGQAHNILLTVHYSGFSLRLQADTLDGLTAFLFGAALAARVAAAKDVSPDLHRAQLLDLVSRSAEP
jgi:hypothetical protein